jgi:hypothetical protein
MPLLGHARWAKNQKYCAGCFRMLRANHGGAEIECSNTTARLSSVAAAGEILVTSATTRIAGLSADALEHRSLPLKGKREPTEVVVLGVSSGR